MGEISSQHAFRDSDKAAVYKAIYQRRDMRHFTPEPVAEELLQKLLQVAHAAPSVGFIQPWRILRMQSPALRQQLHDCVEQERLKTADAMGEKSDAFIQLKVQGVLDLCAPHDG